MTRIIDFETISPVSLNEAKDAVEIIDQSIGINTKLSREWWIIASYVLNRLENGVFTYPISIRKETKPKPDFWIEFDSGSNNLGVEVTYCSVEKYEQALKNCEKLNDGSYPINTSFMKDNVTSYDITNIQLPNEPLHGLPIYGKFAIINTIGCLSKSIEKKIKTYKAFANKYILVIYINLPSKIYIDNDIKRNEILQTLSLHQEWANIFKSIEFIWSNSVVEELVFKVHQVN